MEADHLIDLCRGDTPSAKLHQETPQELLFWRHLHFGWTLDGIAEGTENVFIGNRWHDDRTLRCFGPEVIPDLLFTLKKKAKRKIEITKE
ncbi:MAG: hypothetical protein A3B90_01105 [Candidatus Magasanikbacteria bacterium RIFCSPHIGHO2_02_FULL_41_13]|uniref:Uncharacterized protein n=1 Tax=Candidatus Magasanikbacteria bacterium RIFCSPHIGHO2_02_FULL_41_13 TaxID=1798676 RepID=A0A1F6M517_9BACT|nr:MAG: hypothetical protein A3B90_01105 [Candidatus Magasanikbacteria bacterium RIFCSPHIGHO2_02_FULL_41_13]